MPLDRKALAEALLSAANPLFRPAAGYMNLSHGTGNPEEAAYGAYDELAKLRYGVPSGEKTRMEMSGEVPGVDNKHMSTQKDFDNIDRGGSGYLFGNRWPNLSRVAMPAVGWIREHAFGDDPELVQYGIEQAIRGREDAKAGKKLVK